MDLFKTNGTSPPRPDFELSGHGTVYLLKPLSHAAHAWIDEHLPPDATWFCGAVVVEHRIIGMARRAYLLVALAALLLAGCGAAASPTDITREIQKECATLARLWVEEVSREANQNAQYRRCVAGKIDARMRAAGVGR